MRSSRRAIVVDTVTYHWLMRPGGYGLELSVWRGGGKQPLIALFAPGNLITPWLVRRALLDGLAAGWTPELPGPQHHLNYPEVLSDRPAPRAPVATPTPPEAA